MVALYDPPLVLFMIDLDPKEHSNRAMRPLCCQITIAMEHMHRTFTGVGLFLLALMLANCGSMAGTTHSESANLEDDLRAAEKAWHGSPYAPGGTDFSGVDPVSFVRRLYEELFSLELPRTPSRIATAGQEVAKNDLKAGDLVLFKLSSGPTHVGIYLGRGEFAHVSVEDGVTISRMGDAAWRDTFTTARRLQLPGKVVKQEDRGAKRPTGRQRTGWQP